MKSALRSAKRGAESDAALPGSATLAATGSVVGAPPETPSTPEAAFTYVLASEPRVLAVGEAHAQQGLPGVQSSTRRFAERLLPLLAGKSRHIVIELLLANCKEKTVQAVQTQQAPVTEHQAPSNQNEFVTLGKYAQHLGIEPQGLSPKCSEYESVIAAGENGVPRLLGLVTDTAGNVIEGFLHAPSDPNGPSREVVVSYGGALHNDLYPKAGREAWSFGPRLAKATGGRYVELDLIVPEFVKDTDSWRAQPWFAAFDREHPSDEALLYEPAPRSFALIFPKTTRQGGE